MSADGYLFLSYSSRDHKMVRAVHQFLQQRRIATFFDQQDLRAGYNWPYALDQALKNSSAVAVFIGAQIGNWQWPEIGFALDRQANDQQFPVIPVLLDGADTSRSLLFLNTWVDLRGDRLYDPEALNCLLDAVSSPRSSADAPSLDFNPYRGLESFDEAHAPFFFGHETFIDDLFQRLTLQRKNFVAVIGASGSGKSSVVRAGLIPRLRRQRPPKVTWDVAVFTPGERPWFRLADALGPLRFPDKNGTELDVEIDKLAKALQAGALGLDSLLDRILQRQGRLHRLLLVVDQFEELFTLPPAQERPVFIDRLVASLSVEGLVLVPTLRADFYGPAIEANRSLSDWLGKEQVTLGRLTVEELGRAVVEPARLAGLVFDSGLPDLLLRDAGNEPGNLPLLQHALLELCVARKGNRLSSDAYQVIGGIRKAIVNTAEREFKRFESKNQGNLVRSVFTQLVRLARPDEGQEDTRRRVATASLPSEARVVVDEFASREFRLLVKASERVGTIGDCVPLAREQETVEVAHEAVIREWDRLKAWLNEDRGFYLWRQRLDQAIKDYDEHAANDDFLLQGAALKEAESKLVTAMPEPLSGLQCEFIHASVEKRDRVERETLAAEEQRRREKEALQQRERDALAQAAEQERNARGAAEAAKSAAEFAQQAELRRRQAAERAKWLSVLGAIALLLVLTVAGYQYFEASEAEREKNAASISVSALRKLTYDLPKSLRKIPGSLLVLRELYEQNAKDLDQMLGFTPTDPDAMHDLAIGLLGLGDTWTMLGNDQKAKEVWGRARTLLLRLGQRSSPKSSWLKNLLVSHHRVGDAALDEGEIKEALIEYEAALKIGKAMVAEEQRNSARRNDLWIAHFKVGSALIRLDKANDALKELTIALEIMHNLEKDDPTNADWREAVAKTTGEIGVAFEALGEFEKATEQHWAMLAFIQELVSNIQLTPTGKNSSPCATTESVTRSLVRAAGPRRCASIRSPCRLASA